MHKIYKFNGKRTSLVLFMVLLLWIFYVANGLWKYASIETEPPVFDALSYVQKAQTFWSAVEKGELFNPLSIEPTIRPFGTVLMSYPFGFSEDYRLFYFRSMFIPIIIFSVAFLSITPFDNLSTRQKLIVFVIAIAVTSAPCNYQLQVKINKFTVLGTWGFVDTFFSAIIALSTALVIRNNNQISITHTWLGVLLATFSILVKPIGFVIMILVALVWVIIKYPIDTCKKSKRKFIHGSLAFLIIYGIAFIALYDSAYFSPEHARFGLKGMELIRTMRPGTPTLIDILGKFHVSIGFILSTVLILGLIASFKKKWRRNLIATIVVLTCGFWLWLEKTSIHNIRYALPFIMMSLVIVIPPIISAAVRLSRKAIICVTAMSLMPTLLIGILFAVDRPPEVIQRFTGINLTSNLHSKEVRQAKKFLDELIKEGKTSNIVYYCGIAPPVRSFQAVVDWDRIIGGSKADTIPALPIDWRREHAYRIDDMMKARFIIFELVKNPDKVLSSKKEILTFDSEQLIIRAWLSTLNEDDGVRLQSQSSIRVLEIIDVNAFEIAASKIYHNYNWRKEFVFGYSRRWVPETNFNSTKSNLIDYTKKLRFNGKTIATVVSAVALHDEDDLIIKIYIKHLQPLLDESNNEFWYLFLHLINLDGTSNPVKNIPFDTGNPRTDLVREYIFRLPGKANENLSGFAFGVFSPLKSKHEHLLSENEDWGGRRILIKWLNE